MSYNPTTELEAFINRARIAYYNGMPLIPDELYDVLEKRSGLIEDIGHELEPRDSRFKHLFPMYSLQKVYEGDKPPNYGRNPVVVSPKLDGAAVALTYLNGKLNQALTRGDGKAGLDCTPQMRELLQFDLPEEATAIPIQITGELVAPKTIPNARNYAAGALSLKSLFQFKERQVFFIAYGIQPYLEESYTDNLIKLNEWGFETCIDSPYLEFPHDGEVFRVDSNNYFEELGYTSKHPRGAFALKEKPDGIVTKLLDVLWQVGKSGAISPVAVLEPINIDGAIVSRATLHNSAVIEGLGLEIGCMVEVIRAGGIIPQVISRVD